MEKSIRNRLAVTFIGMMVLFLVMIILINTFFLERVYTISRERCILQTYNTLNDADSYSSLNTRAFGDYLLENNLSLIIVDKDSSQMLYHFAKDAEDMRDRLLFGLPMDLEGDQQILRSSDNYVLENVSGDHTITLVYTRSGLSVLVPGLLGILVFALLVWLIRSERMKRRRARKKELRHMRRKNRSFFQTLEDLDALEKNPPKGSMKEEELYFLLNELNGPEHDSTRRAQEAESGSEPQNSAQPSGEHGDTIDGPDGTAQLPSLPAAGDSPAKDQ